MRLHFDRVHETVHTRTLANGLRISYLEKPGFSKCFAMLATDFGSCDACFTAEGRRWQLPAGVAHFLEHKMFEAMPCKSLGRPAPLRMRSPAAR